MARTKLQSDKKQQLGQFMTPVNLSFDILSNLNFKKTDKVLEPSFGDGSFIIPLIEKFMVLYDLDKSVEDRLDFVLNYNIWGYELDEEMYDICLSKIKDKWGFIPKIHNLYCGDYLIADIRVEFDWVIGNPPFGGTINSKFQNYLEKLYGRRNEMKIKKETYSYFIVKSVELLSEDGKLIFICSDTFKTIKTMEGLRRWLFSKGEIVINTLDDFSEETLYPMVILQFTINLINNEIIMNGTKINIDIIDNTPNFSWAIDIELSKMFTGESIGDYMICSGGLTTGKNEYFIKDIKDDSTIIEEYDYIIYDDLITLQSEFEKAKNNNLSKSKIKEIKRLEYEGVTRSNVEIIKTKNSKVINLPNDKYKYYNVATSDILWSEPSKVIMWEDDGEVVRTYKRNGNWYLHGMGGEKFYNKEGMTWQLISSKIKTRYLPVGYIIDNSSPVGVLRDGVDESELYFIIGWTLSDKCNKILKTVLNHTKNIQNKDIERLPYPTWVSRQDKEYIIDFIKESISNKRLGLKVLLDADILETINNIF
jgi:adenine-specific DNA-methyltransferase